MQDYYQEALAVLASAEHLYNRQQVDDALDRMAKEITATMSEKAPILLCVLNGGIIPAGLLLPRLQFPLQLDTVHATRYRNKTRGGELTWVKKPSIDLQDQAVILVDDILDEGKTLAGIMDYCQQAGARELVSVALVGKRHDRKYQDIKADVLGLEVPDRYVFGCGMDYKGFLRNANGIYAVTGQ